MRNEPEHPSVEELSAWIDGDASGVRNEGGAEALRLDEHVATCERCARTVEELRAIVGAARELASDTDPAPSERAWAAIAARVADAVPTTSRRFPWLVLAAGIAAGVLLALVASAVGGDDPRGDAALAGERFLLLLHESPDLLADASEDELLAVMQRYAEWANDLGARGHLEAGEKLADAEGRWLGRPNGAAPVEPRDARGGLGGFFVLRARDYDEAVELARTCPHLGPGGWLELRRIEDTSQLR